MTTVMCVRLSHLNSRERNKYDYSHECAFFDALLHIYPHNVIIRVEVCDTHDSLTGTGPPQSLLCAYWIAFME